MKNLSRLIIVAFVLITLPAVGYFVMESSGATVATPDQKIVYTLPYPGLLSDHPLYFIKITRDRITEFLTREAANKAKLYLLYSDKRLAMSISLAQKGKNNQAIDALSKAQKYALRIPPILRESKKQGVSAESSFIENLKLSNAKHKEVIEDFLKNLPAEYNGALNLTLDLNDQVRVELESL